MSLGGELNVEDWMYGVMEGRRTEFSTLPFGDEDRMRLREREIGGREASGDNRDYHHETHRRGALERNVATT